MTIASGDPLFSGPYTSTTTGPFDYEFVIFAEDELTVRKKAADGTLSVLDLGTDYTVSPTGGSFPAKGTITLTSALVTDEELVIEPSIALDQTRPFSSQDTITLQEIEDALDKVTSQNRAQQEILERSITVTNFDSVSDLQALQDGILSVAAIESEVVAVAADSADIGTVAADLNGDDNIGAVADDIDSLVELNGKFPNGVSEAAKWLLDLDISFDAAPAIDDFNVTDESIPVGMYRCIAGSLNKPAGVTTGNVIWMRRVGPDSAAEPGGEAVLLITDEPTNLIYTRVRRAGSWSSWIRLLTFSDNPTTGEWITGTVGDLSGISPAKLKATIYARTFAADADDWELDDLTATRVINTSYQNTTDSPMFVGVKCSTASGMFQLSKDNSTWVDMGVCYWHNTYIVPPGMYYRCENGTSITLWTEMYQA